MMTHIRNWALAACSALLLTSYLATTNAQSISTLDPTQIYNTQNLVNSGTDPTATTGTWQNIGLWNQGLPCWAPGGPVYCGPQPYFNNGSFNFSYGYTDVYQTVNVPNSLPNSGTGLRINGFNFGFTAKNGNGWDNGQQDYLVAYVNIYDVKNNLAQAYNYGAYTNRQYNWTTFNFSETFATPYAAKDLSGARYGFIGYDTNGWAGPYGPEIYNVSFSFKYSVDTCYLDVLSSPTCPGYLDAINKLTPPLTSSSSPPPPPPGALPPPPPGTPPPEGTAPPPPPPGSMHTSAPPPIQQTGSATSAAPTATNPQPKIGEVTVSGSPAKTTMSTSQVLTMIRNEQTRIGNLETSTAAQAVEQAQAISDKTQKDSLTISAAVVSQSHASSQAATSVYSIAPTASVQASTFTGITSSTSSYVGLSSNALTNKLGLTSQIEDSNKNETGKLSGTNPVANIINANTPPQTTATTEAAPGPAVNAKAKDNDAAGGMSISNIARQPVGYELYMAAMPDTAFYAPKEIYRNQRIVDNARTQRLLSGASDRLHQDLVNSQYNLGK